MDLKLTEQIASDFCRTQGWGLPTFIAAGNSAAVFNVEHPKQGPVAIKIYDPSFFSGDNALIEEKRIRLQENLRAHGNEYLIEILEVGKIIEANTWYLMMELCPWRTLEDQLSRVPDSSVEELLRQLVSAVQFLEDKGLVHRDIKPANIAINDDFTKVKLLDLGVMRHISPSEGNGTDGDEKKRFIATAQYSSPEYLTREELAGDAGFQALNVYQIGAVLHDLIMKKAIFAEEAATLNKYILYKAITTKRPLLVNPNLPTRLIVLCKTALEKNPTARTNGVTLKDLAAPIDTSDAYAND
jgi:serine/threonine protein kinase